MSKENLHVVTHLERRCSKCKTILSAKVYDYGKISFWEELDEMLGKSNFPLVELECPNCHIKEWPEDLVMYNIADEKMEQMIRSKIGTDGNPVVGGETPYAVTLSTEEQAEYDRGLAKKDDHFKEHEKVFWDGYCSFALTNWKKLIKEITDKEYMMVYKSLGIPMLNQFANVAAWRKDAEKRFDNDALKQAFWREANRYLVEQEFVWTPDDTWPMKKWIGEYGRERVTYITLHVPLPEELEKWRTMALGKVVKKRSGETGVLFERIGQLGQELDKQRNRSVQLSQALSDTRQENAKLSDQVGLLKQKITELQNKPPVLHRDPDDARKIRDLKGLVAELREEVERLAVFEPTQEEPWLDDEPEEGLVSEEAHDLAQINKKEIDLSVLSGKTILVVGWPRETIEEEYTVIWHDGDTVDVKLQAMAKKADIYVVLTRFVSHRAMWWMKEAAIDLDVPIFFMRETNLDRILEIVVVGNKN